MKARYLILSFALGVAVGWIAKTGLQPSQTVHETLHTTDTIYIRDTIRVPSPTLQSTKIIRTDTLIVPPDVEHDTIYVPLPITQLHYRDTIAEAWVSGFRPQLDSLHVFHERVMVTNTVVRRSKPRRWHVGASAGMTVTPAGIAPGVTIGLTYSFIDL